MKGKVQNLPLKIKAADSLNSPLELVLICVQMKKKLFDSITVTVTVTQCGYINTTNF